MRETCRRSMDKRLILRLPTPYSRHSEFLMLTATSEGGLLDLSLPRGTPISTLDAIRTVTVHSACRAGRPGGGGELSCMRHGLHHELYGIPAKRAK